MTISVICNCSGADSYSCLAADFAFRRELRPLVLHFYVPTAALVLASWAPMWLRPRAAKLRVLLGVAALAGVVYASAGVCDTLPPLAYAVAADVWRSGCVLLVAGVLLHYAFLRYVLQTRGTRAAPFIDSAVDSKSEVSQHCFLLGGLGNNFILAKLPHPYHP